MSAGRANLTIEKGTTFARPIFWEQGNPPVGVDLAGASARFVLRRRLRRDLLAELSTDEGGVTISSGGRIDIVMTAEQTAALPSTVGSYVLEVTRAGGVTTRLLEGECYIKRSADE